MNADSSVRETLSLDVAEKTLTGGDTIETHLDRVDEQRFVGRRAERDRVDALLEPASIARVLYVYGEGGIGKSTLLRHATRVGWRAGYVVHHVDGGALDDESAALDDLASQFTVESRPLLVIDRFERMDSRATHLRLVILKALPARGRVVIASRRPPDDGWRRDGWEHLTDLVRIEALSADDSRKLLVARGLTVDDQVDAVVEWAGGLPLALAASCEGSAPGEPNGSLTAQLPGRRSFARLLIDRVVETETGGGDNEAILVAAIAPRVDAALLRGVLDDRNATATMARLRSLSFIDSRSDRVTLHERLAHAIIDELRVNQPNRERQLRLRIADELHARAVDGEPSTVADLRLLVDDDRFRWGLGEAQRDVVYADIVRPGDAATLAGALDTDTEPWWPRIVRWFSEAPDHVVVIRDRGARLAGVGLWATARSAPVWADDDPVLTAVLSHARRSDPTGNALILLDVFDLLGAPDGMVSPVASVGNTAVLLRCGLPNPRLLYAAAPSDPIAATWMQNMGYRWIPDLDLVVDGRRHRYMQMDHGADGVIGTTRSLVYRSYGIEPDPPTIQPLVRAALRNLHDDLALASNPLADRLSGAQVSGAEVLRRMLVAAADEAFGESERDRTMRACLQHGYFDRDASHNRARAELFLSRSAYFRWLGEATERLAAVMATQFDTPSNR